MPVPIPEPELPASDELLVAYLDGELPPDECQAVERQLAESDELRQRLRELDRAWEALDALPPATIRDDFARTTIEMVSLAAQGELSSQRSVVASGKRKRGLLIAGLAVAAATIGFAAVRAMLPDYNRQLVEDLPVLMQYDLLTQIPSVDFLRQLASRIPIEQLADREEELQAKVDRIQLVSSQQPHERGPEIEKLLPEDKATLAAQAERFREREIPEQNRLRALQQEIASAPDADQLQRTLAAYGQWLARRGAGERAELRSESLSTDARFELIDRLVKEDDRQAARQLSDQDARNLRDEIFAIAEELTPKAIENMSRLKVFDRMRERGIDEPEKRINPRDPRWAGLIVGQALWDSDSSDITRERLVSKLSPSAQHQLQKPGRGGRGRDGRNWQLVMWMRQALQPERGPEALERFFDTELSNDQRARLLSLPTAEMKAQLEQLYLESQVGVVGRDFLRDFRNGDRRGPDSPRFDWNREGPPREGGPIRRRGPFNQSPDGPRRRFDMPHDGPPPGGPGAPFPMPLGPGGPFGPPPDALPNETPTPAPDATSPAAQPTSPTKPS